MTSISSLFDRISWVIPDSGKNTESAYGMSHFFMRSVTRLTAILNANLLLVSLRLTPAFSFLSLSWSYNFDLSYDFRLFKTPEPFIDSYRFFLMSSLFVDEPPKVWLYELLPSIFFQI